MKTRTSNALFSRHLVTLALGVGFALVGAGAHAATPPVKKPIVTKKAPTAAPVVTPTPTDAQLADYNKDGKVDNIDHANFIMDWNNGLMKADFDHNGLIEPADVAAFINVYSRVLLGIG